MTITKQNLFLIFFYSLISILLVEIGNYLLNIEHVLHNFLTENLTTEQIERFFEIQKLIEQLNYFVFPLTLFIKTIIIASIVYVGVLFFSKKELEFKKIWNSVLKAEFVFLLVPICKIIWFYFFQTSYVFEDLRYFYPLSAINIIGYNNLDAWFIYPFQTINLFELIYVIYLGYELGKLTETNHDRGLKILAYSYIPMLVLWITIVMFFTLNYS